MVLDKLAVQHVTTVCEQREPARHIAQAADNSADTVDGGSGILEDECVDDGTADRPNSD